MRVRKDESGNVITENVTAPPSSGLFCARDAKGVPLSEAHRALEGAPAQSRKRPLAAKPETTSEPAAPVAAQE